LEVGDHGSPDGDGEEDEEDVLEDTAKGEG